MIIDGHAHIASTHFIPRAFLNGVAANMAVAIQARFPGISTSRILDKLISENQDHEASAFVKQMDEADVERAVLLLPDFTYVMDSELTIAEMAQRHHAVLEKHKGRFHVLMGVDPRWGRDGLDLFEKCIDQYGFSGLKLYPPCGYTASDAILDPYYEICSERGLPVLLHTGPTSPALSFSYSDPLTVDGAAHRFPNVNFILAHSPLIDLVRTVQVCAYRPNVYCDISGFAAAAPKEQWAVFLEPIFRAGMTHKVIFGSDWPVARDRGALANLVHTVSRDLVKASVLTAAEARMVMGATIDRLLTARASRQHSN